MRRLVQMPALLQERTSSMSVLQRKKETVMKGGGGGGTDRRSEQVLPSGFPTPPGQK